MLSRWWVIWPNHCCPVLTGLVCNPQWFALTPAYLISEWCGLIRPALLLPALWTAVTLINHCHLPTWPWMFWPDYFFRFSIADLLLFWSTYPLFFNMQFVHLLAIGSKFCISSRCGDLGRFTDGHWFTVCRIALICCFPVNQRAVWRSAKFSAELQLCVNVKCEQKWAQSVSISSAP